MVVNYYGDMHKFVITGALGQIGTELTLKMRKVYGEKNIIATDIVQNKDNPACVDGEFEVLDVLDIAKFADVVKRHGATYIIHLASLLSVSGEGNPQKLWQLNMGSLYNALELARENRLGVFTPSSIASFGLSTPQDNTPQNVIQRPSTIYGVSKVAGELLCDYYFQKFGVDTRGLRFPGLISYKAKPGGGTTDYAVEIYYKALKEGKFTCPLSENTYLDMMYMDDAIDSIIALIEADSSKLKHRNAFNVSGMSFSPKEIAAEIKKYVPNFEMIYNVNPMLQNIADSWPNHMDITCAKEEWGFSPKFDLEKMTSEMIKNLKIKLEIYE